MVGHRTFINYEENDVELTMSANNKQILFETIINPSLSELTSDELVSSFPVSIKNHG